MRTSLRTILTTTVGGGLLLGVPAPTLAGSRYIGVPPGFVVDILLPEIDGRAPVLEAIRNPAYGFGVVAASVDDGILKVLRVSQASVEPLATQSGYSPSDQVLTTRFDNTGLLANGLYLSVAVDVDADSLRDHTYLLEVSADGEVSPPLVSLGTSDDKVEFLFEALPQNLWVDFLRQGSGVRWRGAGDDPENVGEAYFPATPSTAQTGAKTVRQNQTRVPDAVSIVASRTCGDTRVPFHPRILLRRQFCLYRGGGMCYTTDNLTWRCGRRSIPRPGM